jgi:hypothetical protein
MHTEQTITKYYKTNLFIQKIERNKIYLYIDGTWIETPTNQLPPRSKEITQEEAFREILLE